MFTPDFTLPAKMMQSFTELATNAIAQNMKIMNDVATANLETSRKMLSGLSTEEKKKETPPPFFPTPFNYFPNLYKTEEKSSFPLTPFAWFEQMQKQASSSPFPMTNVFTEIMQKQSAPVTPFTFFNPLQPAFDQMKSNGGAPSFKGFMVFFDVPLKDFGFDKLPWANFPTINAK